MGYRFEYGYIVRIDSELLHAQVVAPPFKLFHDQRFSGPHSEYLLAHDHYRAGRTSDAITNANSAFESTMKIICHLKGWEYKGDRATDLVKVLRANGLFPHYLDVSLDQLIAAMKSGLPVVRNKAGVMGRQCTVNASAHCRLCAPFSGRQHRATRRGLSSV
jgi:hypothetical protein